MKPKIQLFFVLFLSFHPVRVILSGAKNLGWLTVKNGISLFKQKLKSNTENGEHFRRKIPTKTGSPHFLFSCRIFG